MTRAPLILLALCALLPLDARAQGLLEARKGHTTKLVKKVKEKEVMPPPASPLFALARYKGPAGALSAYVSKPVKPGVKYPAILWITGGFPTGGIGPSAWENDGPRDRDQSAKTYREAGMVMMYPTVRGSFANGGLQESFYGEVDDVLAAADYLASLDYVDPKQIYLGGHSTGGTLALLVAQASPRFRAVISFGPASDPANYGAEALSYDPGDAKERRLRAPIRFLEALKTPTFVIEGETGRVDALAVMRKATKNPNLHCIEVKGATHFNVLYPVNRLIAKKLQALEGGAQLSLTKAEVNAAFRGRQDEIQESRDLDMLARARGGGASLEGPTATLHYFFARTRSGLDAAAKAAKSLGYAPEAVQQRQDNQGRPYFLLRVEATVSLGDLKALFKVGKALTRIAARHELQYEGWEPK